MTRPSFLAASVLVLLAYGLAAAASARADPLPQCLAELRAESPRNRVSTEDFDRLTADARTLERVITSRASQAEVVDPWWDYVPRTVDERRVRARAISMRCWPTTARRSTRCPWRCASRPAKAAKRRHSPNEKRLDAGYDRCHQQRTGCRDGNRK
jgi:Transglycosylase SLT domain